jgi:hypothetical protein
MDFEVTLKEIKKLHWAISNKEADVLITFKGNGYGVTKPWNLRCDGREVNGESHTTAAAALLKMLEKELREKVQMLEAQTNSFKQVLSDLQKN